MSAGFWTPEVVSGVIAGVIAVLGGWGGVGVWVGYHKREHKALTENITALREEYDVTAYEHAHRTDSCPMGVPSIKETLNKNAVALERIETNQKVVMDDARIQQGKLDHLVEKTSRVERLEAKMDASEADRTNLNRKLDQVISDIGELRGALDRGGRTR